MVEATEFQALSNFLWLWQAYDPAIKSELFSSAVKMADGLFFIDPIPLSSSALDELTGNGNVAGIIVTNANHIRASQAFATRFSVPIFASAIVVDQLPGCDALIVAGEEKISPVLTTITLEGAAPGEIALHLSNDGGTIVIGDALINFEPFGFAVLPPKYCSDQKLMRKSLRQLLDFRFERLLFAHGIPILSSARTRLDALLTDCR